MPNTVIELDDNNFEETVLQNSKTVFVDFSASWCGPCNFMAPFFAEVAEETPSAVFAHADIDKIQQYAAKFGIRSVPTIIVFNKEEIVTKQTGAMNKAQLTNFVNEILNK